MAVKDFDFSHYYTYQELVDYLSQVAEAYPKLIQLKVIGQSYAGRDIWLGILTNQETGNYLEKPGYWIDANTHAGEVTGSAVACDIIYYLLTQYHQDPQATRLLDHYTIYVLPRLAVDGAEKYLTTPHRLRSSVRPYPYPDEQDGLHQEDVNGDGLILQMQIKDECGAWKVSELDPRLMVRREPAEFGGTYYTLLPEGLIRNYDGYSIKLAPPLEGMDFNRNYPHQWSPEAQQKGAGDFPFSEPETRAEAEFWHQNRNINGFISYHTYSAVILRPYSTHPDEHFPVEDLEIYQLIGEQGKQITGYKCVSVYHDFRYHPKEVTYGAMDDYGYDHFGWFGFTIELWDAPTEAGIEKQDYVKWFRYAPPEETLKLLKWNDEKLGGKGFINWQPFHHPQLGEVEIGGWDEKAVWQNAPAEYLPDLCEKQCHFAIAHALISPCLALTRTEVTYQGGDIYHVVVQWQNQGFLPTYTSQKALERQSVRPIEVILSLPEGVTLISGQLEQEIEHLEGRANKAFEKFAPGTDFRRHGEWVVKGPPGSEIEYIVGDVCELGQIGSFEVVVASYLLNCARTKEQLLKLCQTISANLLSGGRFVTINANVQQPPKSYPICKKYGYTKSISEPLQEGTPITLTFSVNGQKFSLIDYYLSRATYEWAFRSVGFKEIRWHQPIVSPEGIQKFGQEFWQDFLDHAPMIGIECLK